MALKLVKAILVILTLCQSAALLINGRIVPLSMPNVRPEHDETYLCSATRLPMNQHEFIVRFEPNASATKVHHILLYGCEVPGKFLRDTPELTWECGEMAMTEKEARESSYDHGQVCANGYQSILFSWALDAPSIDLPPGVGFKIGGNQSRVNFIVLQVHYGNTKMFRDDPNLTDNSGIILHTVPSSDRSITKRAGILLMVSYGYVIEGKSRHEMTCSINEDKIIHPFRFRTHTHKLGTQVAGYKRPFNAPSNQLQLIGKHDPQQPQMFYPVENTIMKIGQGDGIYAYCDYNNNRGHDVMIGATGNDEMCNFYIMYWTDGPDLLEQQDCLQYNPSNHRLIAAFDEDNNL